MTQQQRSPMMMTSNKSSSIQSSESDNEVSDYGSMAKTKMVETIDEENQTLLPAHSTTDGAKSDARKESPTVTFDESNDLEIRSYGSSFQFDHSSFANNSAGGNNSNSLRRIAMNASLYVNFAILAAKTIAYLHTLSLAVLAALLDSVLDIVSQLVLYYTERTSERHVGRSSEIYPAGAARLEPIGVLTCAALMGMASFEVLKESVEALIHHHHTLEAHSWSSVWSMALIVVIKLVLLVLCQKAGEGRTITSGSQSVLTSKAVVVVSDPTMEALALDHLNDALSNAVAAVALILAIARPWLWWVDPVGAIAISVYIIFSWFTKGKEQIEQLTGKAAPTDLIEELREIASNHDPRIVVDVCRAYHFGPKFLVELEIVLPKNTLLFESHDIGMDLQYEIEAREEVERCFVHIDYEKRNYDEHVVSKVPELLELIRKPDNFTPRSISL